MPEEEEGAKGGDQRRRYESGGNAKDGIQRTNTQKKLKSRGEQVREGRVG